MNSKQQRRIIRHRRTSVLLLLAIISLALTVSTTGCKTVELVPVDGGKEYRQMLAEELPQHPDLPVFPGLSWQYSNGRYSISEADVDKLLDYRDNALPQYSRDTEVYLKKVKIIVDALVEGGTGGSEE